MIFTTSKLLILQEIHFHIIQNISIIGVMFVLRVHTFLLINSQNFLCPCQLLGLNKESYSLHCFPSHITIKNAPHVGLHAGICSKLLFLSGTALSNYFTRTAL